MTAVGELVVSALVGAALYAWNGEARSIRVKMRLHQTKSCRAFFDVLAIDEDATREIGGPD